MIEVPIILPALGEGIRQIRVLRLLKNNGSSIERDEPVAEVETDKATFTIESPATGTLKSWQVEAGVEYPVGSVAAIIRAEPSDEVESKQASLQRNARLSPRARTWCMERGINPAALAGVDELGHGRISIADLERWIGEQKPTARTNKQVSPSGTATVEVHADWDAIVAGASRHKTRSQVWIAWATSKALAKALARDSHLEHRLGIAVALLRDGLTVSPLPNEESQGDLAQFELAFKAAVDGARMRTQRLGDCALVLSDMSSFGIRSATPVVTPPSIATLFVGAPFVTVVLDAGKIGSKREVKLVLAFEHAVLNGVGAARFLRDVLSFLESNE
jgi:2-oxoisovalerate dehydrogenase E1 component